MSVIDSSGNIHKGVGTPGAGRFDGKINSAPAGALLDADGDGHAFVIGGDSSERITVAQARRELGVGQRVQVAYLNGPRADDDGEPILRTVAKQTPHEMITAADGNDRGVHLDWAHRTVEQDENGTLIISGSDGLPLVAHIPLDDDSQAVRELRVQLPVVEDLNEAKVSADPAALVRQAGHPASGVQRAVAKNTHTPAEALTVIAQTCDEEYTLERVAEHPNADSGTMDALAACQSKSVRFRAAGSGKVSAHTLVALANDSESGVRSAAGRNLNTPTEVLDRLAGDRNSDVRQSVASNPRTSPEILDRLSRSDGFSMAQVGRNTAASESTLRRLADDTSTGNQTRAMVASNPAAPRDIIARSVSDADDWVRQHAAENPNLTSAETAQLAVDRSEKVRRAIARSSGAARLTVLAHDQDPFVRSAYAKNPALSPDVLAALADDQFHAVRTAVAGNPNTPIMVLQRLAALDGVTGSTAQASLAGRM